MSDIERARQLFSAAGLGFPSVPVDLASQLTERGKWLFSTRELGMSPYNLDHYVKECSESSVGDYALLAHSGHGINSYAIQYYLVQEPLRMFLHLGWGGGYMDNDAAAKDISENFKVADQIIEAARISEKLGTGSHLTVVACDFYGSYWLYADRDASIEGVDPGRPADLLRDVLDWLQDSDGEGGDRIRSRTP